MKVLLINEDGKIPTQAYESDAGLDVYSPIDTMLVPKRTTQIKLGIAIEIEKDEVAIMSERSSAGIAGITSVGNIIDSGYRGEISIILFNSNITPQYIHKGDKIGQIVICKLGNRNIEVVNQLSDSPRSANAHGSSGK